MLEPGEVEFLAESVELQVVPSFRGGRVSLIGGSLGPFEPGVALSVPGWLALSLRRRRLARLLPPAWLTPSRLREALERERAARLFAEAPAPHYLLQAKLVLAAAAEDVAHCDEVRTLVKDIWDVRQAKLRASQAALLASSTADYGRLDHLTLMEVNCAKPLLPLAMDHLCRLQKNAQKALNASTTNLSTSYMNVSSFSTT